MRRIKLKLLLAILGFGILLNVHAAQERPEQVNPPATTNHTDMRMMQHMHEMDSMAKSMTSMADMCRMMMEKEMRGRPAKMAALAIVGTLGVAALALLVVLEIQWICFWSIRTQTERLKLTATKSKEGGSI